MSDQLRLGVVGCGYWGSKHARVLSGLESIAVSIIDPDEYRLSRAKAALPAVSCFRDVETALDEVDAVVIATPPSTHHDLAMQAMDRGVDVMVEKPLATSVDEAASMMARAEDTGSVLMVGHTFEYHAAVSSLRDMVRAGELGDLYYIDTARLNLGLYQNDVNVIWDLAPHDVAILNYVLDSTPDSVQCWASRHAHPHLEDIAYLRLHYSRPELFANVHVSWLDPCKVRRVTVVGSERMVVFNDLSNDDRIRVHNKGVLELPVVEGDMTQPPMSYRYGDVVSPYLVVQEPLAVEDQHFVDCVRHRTVPRTNAASGLAVVAALESAQVSLREDRAVRLDELDRTLVAGDALVPRQSQRATVGDGLAPVGLGA